MLLDALKATEIVVALIVVAFGGLSALVLAIDRRQRKRAIEAVAGVKTDHKSASDKLDRLTERVGNLEGKVDAGLGDSDSRLRALEKSMETVARQADIVAMAGEIGGMKEAVRGTAKQVSMLYEAALSREKNGS